LQRRSTEYKYFKELRKQYSSKFNEQNLQVEILRRPSKQSGNSSPKYVEQMLNEFLEDNRDYELKSYDELWLIIDTDTWEQETIKQLAEKCQTETLYHLGLSNPCFEIGLILLMIDFNEDIEHAPTPKGLNVKRSNERSEIKSFYPWQNLGLFTKENNYLKIYIRIGKSQFLSRVRLSAFLIRLSA